MQTARPLRLLVVEDDAVVAEDIARMLAGMGVTVVGPVGDVDAAMGLARIAVLDGAVLDVSVGGRGVYPVIDVLAERGLPVILSTGYDPSALPRAAQALPRLRKPFGARKLERLIDAVFPRPDDAAWRASA